MVFHIHALILGTTLHVGPVTFVCYFQRGVYRAQTWVHILSQQKIDNSFLCYSWTQYDTKSAEQAQPLKE